MSLVPHREWSSFFQLRDEVNRLFNSMQGEETSSATATWVPAVDIHEYDDRFALFVDVPGVDPGQVEITLADGLLTLSGQRTTEKPGAKEGDVPMRIERATGAFHRRFILPDSIEGEQIKAAGRNGVLEISIPKKAKAQPRRIKVASGT